MEEHDEDEVVRIDAVLTIEVSTVVSRDTYEAWQDGDDTATYRILNELDQLAIEETQALSPTITEAWLVETGQGHPIVRLKEFK